MTFRNMEAEEKGAGVEGLRILQESVLSTFARAEQIQEDESVKAWLTYQANYELGTHEKPKSISFAGKGADLSKIMGTRRRGGEAKPTPGVLSVEIEGNPDDPTIPVKVKSASLKGLNKAYRKRLEKLPIGEWRIPIVAWHPMWGDRSAQFFSIGVNEGRAAWYSTQQTAGRSTGGYHSNRSGLYYLYFKIHHEAFRNTRTQADFDRISMEELHKNAPWGSPPRRQGDRRGDARTGEGRAQGIAVV